jgi:hypothetical protein
MQLVQTDELMVNLGTQNACFQHFLEIVRLWSIMSFSGSGWRTSPQWKVLQALLYLGYTNPSANMANNSTCRLSPNRKQRFERKKIRFPELHFAVTISAILAHICFLKMSAN